jgi:hypothetical protein
MNPNIQTKKIQKIMTKPIVKNKIDNFYIYL